MGTSHFISARVPPETKAQFRKLAEQQQTTESGLLKRLVDSAVRSAGEIDADFLKSAGRQLRGSRTNVRLRPDDKLLLRERAASRQMAVATYISVLVRAHLRSLSPLPKDELMVLKQSVAEIGAIGRNLNQLTRLAHQVQADPPEGSTRHIEGVRGTACAHQRLDHGQHTVVEGGHGDDQD